MLYSGGNSTGLSFYIKYADYSTADNPIMIAKGIDKNGNELEQTIRIRDIDPYHATIIEMRAMCQWPFEKPHFWSLKNQQFWP